GETGVTGANPRGAGGVKRPDIAAKADRYFSESAAKAGVDDADFDQSDPADRKSARSSAPQTQFPHPDPVEGRGHGARSGFAGRIDLSRSARQPPTPRTHNQPPSRGAGLYSSARAGGPREIEGQLVAKSDIPEEESRFAPGDRVHHAKFGPGTVAVVEGNKLTVDFDKAGQKRVLDGFVQGVG
ncbi:MAG: DUF3553 domain-containing protein, partial [Rhizobiaceae bacterium]|nr:DUF3553 domain-containing protein [Rhizobiaceae bacterium]